MVTFLGQVTEEFEGSFVFYFPHHNILFHSMYSGQHTRKVDFLTDEDEFIILNPGEPDLGECY